MRGLVAISFALGLLVFGYVGLSGGWPIWLVSLFGAFALACIYYALAGMAVVAIFLRAILAMLPIGAAAGAIIYFVISRDILETEETRAVIAAIVVAAGWIVAFVTGEMRQTNLQQERRRDTIRAALVEIQQILAATAPTRWDDIAKETKAEFEKDSDYVIFVMYAPQFSVLKRLIEQVEILHKDQIERVMALYQLLDRIEEIEERFDMEQFKSLPWQRRQKVVLRYIELQKKVPTAAERAEAALKDAPFWGLLRRLR